MKPIILALVLSIILHLLLFVPFKFEKDVPKKEVVPKVEKKSSVRYVKIQPKIVPKPKTEKEVVKKVEKPKNYKIVKKRKIVPQKKISKKRRAKKIPATAPKKIVKKFTPKKSVTVRPQEKRKTIPQKNLENFLLSEPVPLDKSMLDEITQSYLKLYGKEYEKLTNVQKVFIQNSIKSIVEITRSYYRFPSLALKLRKNDYNIVEFTLHPNGDISGLRIVQPGNYSFYDKSILEAIQYAYKDYPRPKEATKIKFYITYRVY
jgi:protein TonB